MSKTNLIRPASEQDRSAIIALLEDANLPTQDLPPSLAHFLVGEELGQLVGCVGLELLGEEALLRSLVVIPSQRGTGWGKRLYQAAWTYANTKHVRTVYLITTTADRFFEKQEFFRVERSDTPASLQATAQFTEVCPSSAIVMYKAMDK